MAFESLPQPVSPFRQAQETQPDQFELYLEIFKNTETIPDGLDLVPQKFHERLALRLIEEGRGLTVINNFDDFEDTSSVRVVSSLIENGYDAELSRFLGRFHGLDRHILHKLLATKQRGMDIGKNLFAFIGLTYDDAELLIDGFWTTNENILKNPDTFIPEDRAQIALHLLLYVSMSWLPETVGSFFPNEKSFQEFLGHAKDWWRNNQGSEQHFEEIGTFTMQEKLTQRDYLGLRRVLDLYGGKLPEEVRNPKDARAHLAKLTGQGTSLWAREFLAAMEKSRIGVEPAVRKNVQEQAAAEEERRNHRTTRALEFGRESVVVGDEIGTFYLDNLIEHYLSVIGQEMERANKEHHESDFYLRARKMTESTKELQLRIQKDTTRQFHWMREYLVAAVRSEMRHQDYLEDPENDVEPSLKFPADQGHRLTQNEITDRLLELGTNEEIREYLLRSQERFNHPVWSFGYGGSSWAEIARSAFELWRSDDPNIPYMDHAFDLEHNSGGVFDKRPDRVKGDDKRDANILNAKKHTQTLYELYREMDHYATDAFKPVLKERMEAFEKIRSAYDKLAPVYHLTPLEGVGTMQEALELPLIAPPAQRPYFDEAREAYLDDLYDEWERIDRPQPPKQTPPAPPPKHVVKWWKTAQQIR